MTKQNKKAAVIGLGSMGLPMSLLLINNGWNITGIDKREEPLKIIEERSAIIKRYPSEIDKEVDLILLMVINEKQCEEIIFGEKGLHKIINNDRIIINCATVTPKYAIEVSSRLDKLGIPYLDAPVSGGTGGARTGTLTVMASGSSYAIDQSRTLLNVLSKNLYHLNEKPGAGSYMKVINQLLCGINLVSTAEALALGKHCGLSQEIIYEVIKNSAGNSYIFEDRAPRMMKSDPDVASAVNIFVKDLSIVMETAKDLNFPIKLANIALNQFKKAQSSGLGLEDDSSVIKTYK